MIDEFGERLVDRLIDWYGVWSAPWKIRFKRSALGFRCALIGQSLKKTGALLFNKLATAGEEDGFISRLMAEPVEPVDEISLREWIDAALIKANAALGGRMFAFLLLMMAQSALLLCGRASGEIAMLAAFFGLQWLAEALETDYEPLAGPVRQRYLAAAALRAAAYLAVTGCYFFAYAQRGLKINIILQGTMGLTIAVHAILFVSFVAFNKKQQLFLRLLCGVLGLLPALACASGAALGAATAAAAPMVALGGAVRGIGIALAFLSEQAGMVCSLGGNRLRFGKLWKSLLSMTGFFMMLCGAWLCVL